MQSVVSPVLCSACLLKDFLVLAGNVKQLSLFLCILALIEESMHYSVTQRIDCQFWNPEKILPGKEAMAVPIQAGKPGIQPLNLLLGKACLSCDLYNVL